MSIPLLEKSFWEYDPLIKSIDDCRKCGHHIKIKGSSVICERVKGIFSIVHIIPSCWNIGFKNTDIVVRCLKEKEGELKDKRIDMAGGGMGRRKSIGTEAD